MKKEKHNHCEKEKLITTRMNVEPITIHNEEEAATLSRELSEACERVAKKLDFGI